MMNVETGKQRLVVAAGRVREVAEARGFYGDADEMRPPNVGIFYAGMDEMRPPNVGLFYEGMDEMRPPNAPR